MNPLFYLYHLAWLLLLVWLVYSFSGVGLLVFIGLFSIAVYLFG